MSNKVNLMASDVARNIHHISDDNLAALIEIAMQEQDSRNAGNYPTPSRVAAENRGEE
jgi:hypothetical protein